jgi:hypothetical protein
MGDLARLDLFLETKAEENGPACPSLSARNVRQIQSRKGKLTHYLFLFGA